MTYVKSLEEFKVAPMYWREYKRLGIAFACFWFSIASVYAFEKQWVTVVASCLSLLWLIVQIEVSIGSRYHNVCVHYEEYL